MKTENKERKYKIMFTKQKQGSYTARVIVPMSIIKDLDIKPGDSIRYTRIEKGVVIKKCD
jgi:hypothetical protein